MSVIDFPTASCMPMNISSTRSIPQRVNDTDRVLLRHGIITYEIIIKYDITVSELNAMQVCLKQYFWDCADMPDAKNVTFTDMDESTLEIVTLLFQNTIMKMKIPKLEWFAAGLTIQDMVRLIPKTPTLKVWNVDIDSLIKHDVYKTGETWAQMMKWTNEDWYKLGFDYTNYEKFIRKKHTCSTDYKRYLLWGPSVIKNSL